MFVAHATHRTNWKLNATITSHFNWDSSGLEVTWHRDVIVFENVFGLRQNAKAMFLNSSALKNVFEKLRVRDGLVWTVGVTEEVTLRFQISTA